MEISMTAVDEWVAGEFHDNRIHGFQLVSDDLRSEILFDIDHILQWPDCVDGSEEIFEVAKATLRFNTVTDTNISIRTGCGKYATTPGEIFIERIERTSVTTPIRVAEYYLWKIRTNHDGVVIEFGAAGFSLEISEIKLKVPRQHLTQRERS
jgi:hypothetical protein